MSEIDGHVLRLQWLALIHPNILLNVKIKENIPTMLMRAYHVQFILCLDS